MKTKPKKILRTLLEQINIMQLTFRNQRYSSYTLEKIFCVSKLSVSVISLTK